MAILNYKSFQYIWLLGFGIHLLIFTFVLDIYFTSPIKHGMTPHKVSGPPLAKRIVIFIADGLRAEAIFPRANWKRVEYLTDLRLNQDSAWGIVHTGVPTESRPGHVAIFGGLYEDPSALFTGWQANIVEFDSVINESNYAWSFGSPDIVKIFTKHNKYKLQIECYDPDQEDFSGRSSTINLDAWVFSRVKELLTPKGNSCEAQLIRNRFEKRELEDALLDLQSQQAECNQAMKSCMEEDIECQKRAQICADNVNSLQIDLSLKQINMEIATMNIDPVCMQNKATFDCTPLCESGNVFFLHLLGMDTAGHVHKPDSKEYLANLKAIDQGIKQTEKLFREYFNDDETAFLFTSDHGMTNWGSHGDGSEHETEVPFILWGKGVLANHMRFDLNQVDMAPLIASLLGITIPMNSAGVLPHQLLNGSDNQILEAVYVNVWQLLEQYYCLIEEFKRDPLFVEFPVFQGGKYIRKVEETFEAIFLSIKESNKKKQLEYGTKLGQEAMAHILQANQYMRYYYFKPKIACVILGLILWMGYLQLSIHRVSNVTEGSGQISSTKGRNLTIIFRNIVGVLVVATCIIMAVVNANLFSYLYPLFPLGILFLYIKDCTIVNQLLYIINSENRNEFLYQTVIYGILVQLLVVGFFHRLCCALVVIILALWLTQNHHSLNIKAKWFTICSMLALLQIFEPSMEFKHFALIAGSVGWIGLYFIFILPMANEYMQYYDIKYKSAIRKIIMAPLCAYILAAANIYFVASDISLAFLDLNLGISWILSTLMVMLIPLVPKGVVIRFAHIAACLIVPYTLMAVNIDLIFYTILIITLYFWMFIETTIVPTNNFLQYAHFAISYSPKKEQILSTQYRQTYFYMALTICYFFAIGNMASFNGFDPLWTRAFVTTFNPILMATLIIIKMVIPFFLITCAFYAIVLVSRQDYTNVFMILLLFLDQMVLNFMLFVRNEGSWKEIGKSLSHFALMEAMGLVMLLFFACAKYVCSFCIGDEQSCNLREESIWQSKRSQVKNKCWHYVRRFICKKRKFHKDSDRSKNPCNHPFDKSKSLRSKEIRRHLENKQKVLKTQELSKKATPKLSNTLLDNEVSEQKQDYVKKHSNYQLEVKRKRNEMKNRNENATLKQNNILKSKKTELDDGLKLPIASRSEIEQATLRNKPRIVLNTKISRSKVASKISNSCLGDIKQGNLKEMTFVRSKISKRKARSKKSPKFSKIEQNSEHLCSESITQKPVSSFTYYDIFPRIDKMQKNEVRTLFLKPFYNENSYLNASTFANVNSDKIGIISLPSLDDLDCKSKSSSNEVSKSRYSFIEKEQLSEHSLRQVQSSFIMIGSKMEGNRKTPSCSELENYGGIINLKTEDKRCLTSQVEEFNFNKSDVSTMPNTKKSSNISIIRTESYFDPSEIEPAGKRTFRTSRTSFNNPDVLKLTASLSIEEAAFRFMSHMQKKSHLKKLLNSNIKSPSQEALIKRMSKSQKKISNTSMTSNRSSIHSTDEVYEVLHKEAVRNQKQLRRHRKLVMKQLVKNRKLEGILLDVTREQDIGFPIKPMQDISSNISSIAKLGTWSKDNLSLNACMPLFDNDYSSGDAQICSKYEKGIESYDRDKTKPSTGNDHEIVRLYQEPSACLFKNTKEQSQKLNVIAEETNERFANLPIIFTSGSLVNSGQMFASGDAAHHSHLNEGKALPAYSFEESTNFSGSFQEEKQAMMSFQGVCTSLRKGGGCDSNKSNTCSQYLTKLDLSVSPLAIANTDLSKMPRDPNSPRDAASTFDHRRSYPSFFDEGGADPSVYLLKVENWLKSSEPTDKIRQFLDLKAPQRNRFDSESHTSNSTSTVAAVDFLKEFIENGPSIYEMPNKNLIIKMAQKMIKDKVLPCNQNISQVFELISYILKLAEEISEEVPWARHQGVAKKHDCITSSTQVTIRRKNQACNTSRVYQTHIGIQHAGYSSRFLGTSTQSVQTCMDTVTRGTMVKEASPRITTSIGIQNCFDSIGVGTETISERISIGTQSAVETRDAFSVSHFDGCSSSMNAQDDDIAIRESLSGILHRSELSTISEVSIELSSEALEISPKHSCTTIKSPPTLPDRLCNPSERLRRREGKGSKILTILCSPEKPPAFVPPLVLPTRSYESTIASASDNMSTPLSETNVGKKCPQPLPKQLNIAQVMTDVQFRPIDELIHNYARREASKYSSPENDTNRSSPKVRSVPRTDYSELPEFHRIEAENCVHVSPPTSGRHSARTEKVAPFSIPKHAKLGPLPKHEDVILGEESLEGRKSNVIDAARRLPQISHSWKREKTSPRKLEQVLAEN